jgi:hypothetical protein
MREWFGPLGTRKGGNTHRVVIGAEVAMVLSFVVQ